MHAANVCVRVFVLLLCTKYVCMYVCLYVRVCVCVCVYVVACVCVSAKIHSVGENWISIRISFGMNGLLMHSKGHTHTHTHTHTQTHTHAHTHAYTHNFLFKCVSNRKRPNSVQCSV